MKTPIFPWGKVTQVHTIGTHEVIEYVVGDAYSHKGDTAFHLSVGEYGVSYESLDEAILASICMKNGGDYEDVPYVKRVMNWKD
jgi:hypothetical protein